MTKYTDDQYRATAKRMLSGDNFTIAPNAPVSQRPEDENSGARVQVWLYIDSYEVAETLTRKATA